MTDIIPRTNNTEISRYTGAVNYNEEAVRYQQFRAARKAVLTDSDFIKFLDKHGREHVAMLKQGVYKLKRISRISVGETQRRYFDTPNNGYCVEIHVVAISPSGESATGVGLATEVEKNTVGLSLHNRAALAETRANIRAISNLLALDDRFSDDLGPEEQIISPTLALPIDDTNTPREEDNKGDDKEPTTETESNTETGSDMGPADATHECNCLLKECIPDDNNNICTTCDGIIPPPKLKALKKQQK